MRNPLEEMRIRRGRHSNTFGQGIRVGTDGNRRSHQGWDLYAPTGTAVYAIADGIVEFSQTTDDQSFGKQICVRFQDTTSETPRTLYAFYGHLSRVDKLSGEVKEGDVLGATGTTGNARGMTGLDQHLHFEIRTIPRPGLGIAGRLDPADILGPAPM